MQPLGQLWDSVELHDHAFISSLPLKNKRPVAQTPIQLWNHGFQWSAKVKNYCFFCLRFSPGSFLNRPSAYHYSLFFNLWLLWHTPSYCAIRRYKPTLRQQFKLLQWTNQDFSPLVRKCWNHIVANLLFSKRLKMSQTASYLLINNYLWKFGTLPG